MKKTTLRNVSAVAAYLTWLLLAVFSNYFSKPGESLHPWIEIIWTFGSVLSFTSGIITWVNKGEIKNFCKFFNAFSALFFFAFLVLVALFMKINLSFSVMLILILAITAAIARIIAEIISALEFTVSFSLSDDESLFSNDEQFQKNTKK